VNLDYSSSTYPALRKLVTHRLHQVLHIQAQNWCIESSLRPTVEAIHQLQPDLPLLRDIPIKFVKNQTHISYVSAIALLLEKSWQKPALKIAQSLVETLVQTTQEQNFTSPYHGGEPVWKHFLFEANSSGWLTLKLSDLGLAEWLQSLIYLAQKFEDSPKWMTFWTGNSQNLLRDSTDSPYFIRNPTDQKFLPRNSTDLFLAQHAHGRCCSLIRLGKQTEIIDEATFGVEPLSWLLSDRSIRGWHRSEWELIEQICQSCDRTTAQRFPLISSEPDKTVKLMRGLSQAFERFYRDCSIFGEVRMNDPALAQVRLGLVAVVRSLLQVLLDDLGEVAPTEL
jgi:arginyl-tRNA synthetase